MSRLFADTNCYHYHSKNILNIAVVVSRTPFSLATGSTLGYRLCTKYVSDWRRPLARHRRSFTPVFALYPLIHPLPGILHRVKIVSFFNFCFVRVRYGAPQEKRMQTSWCILYRVTRPECSTNDTCLKEMPWMAPASRICINALN